MKSSKNLLCGMSILLVLLSVTSGVAAPLRDWSNWVAHYYENPQPEKMATAIQALSRAGYFEESGQPGTAIGFFSTVFAQHPEKVAGWVASFRSLPPAHQRLMAVALWYSGVPQGQAYVKAQVRLADEEMRAEIEPVIAMAPPSLDKSVVDSESALNLQWGAFVASGDQQHVINVLSALGSGEAALSSKARAALAAKAAAHAKVYAICKAQLAGQPAEVRAELTAALAVAGSPKS